MHDAAPLQKNSWSSQTCRWLSCLIVFIVSLYKIIIQSIKFEKKRRQIYAYDVHDITYHVRSIASFIDFFIKNETKNSTKENSKEIERNVRRSMPLLSKSSYTQSALIGNLTNGLLRLLTYLKLESYSLVRVW